METSGQPSQSSEGEQGGEKKSRFLACIGAISSLRTAIVIPPDKFKTVADEAAIHGIKQAFYSNRFGRIFWTLVFVGCAVIMTWQLAVLFGDFTSIGTKVVRRANKEYIDGPVFYYCNKFWMPHPEAVEQFLTCTGFLPHIDRNENMHVNQTRDIDTFYRSYPTEELCKLEYTHAIELEMLVNQILAPKNPDLYRHDRFFPQYWSYYGIYEKFLKTLITTYGGSLYSYVVNTSFTGKLSQPATGVVTEMPNNMSRIADDLYDHAKTAQTLEITDPIFKRRIAELSLTLDGVCWKIDASPVRQNIAEAAGQQTKHVVLHYGAYGYGLKPFIKRFGVEAANFSSLLNSPPSVISRRGHERVFTTYAGIAARTENPPFLEEGILLSSTSRSVVVKYWYEKTSRLGQRSDPCRTDWTLLDQVHCNNHQRTRRGHRLKYLPKSKHFDEVVLTNETHIHNYDPWAIGEETIRDLRISLLDGTNECPQPCSRQTFRTEVIHLAPDNVHVTDKELHCLLAYEALLMDRQTNDSKTVGADSNNEVLEIRRRKFRKNLRDLKGAFYHDWNKLKNSPKRRSSFNPQVIDPLPCTFVTYEHVESRGFIYNEYDRHTWSEVASNLGGTLGLWTGASVMSFVQIIYVCCLRRLLTGRTRRRSVNATEMV